jgi:competence protein ComEC
LLLFLALCLSALAADLKVHVLDVGQGDAILIEAPGDKRVLVDAGTSGAGVVGMLRDLGIDRLDLVIATHPHADHIGGIVKVLGGIPVGMYVDNGMTHTTLTYSRTMASVENKEIPYRIGISGRVFNVGDQVTMTVLHPRSNKLRGTRSDLNSNSVVIRIDHKNDCILLTGDAEEPSERALMRDAIEPCDVLKVAHHGSAHSTSMEWLRAIQPRIAVISVGEGNRYRHPSQDTLNRLERSQVEVHRTDLEGTITLISTGRGVTVESDRPQDTDTVADASADLASITIPPPPPPTPTESEAKPEKKRKKCRFFQWLFGQKNKKENTS